MLTTLALNQVSASTPAGTPITVPVTVARSIGQSIERRSPRSATTALTKASTVATLATSGSGASSNSPVSPSRISASANPVRFWKNVATATQARKPAFCQPLMWPPRWPPGRLH
jgi:hypothetical protein